MSRFALLATMGQDWSLFGWPVWLSLVVGTGGALATTGRQFPPTSVQLRLAVILPVVAFSFCLLSLTKNWPGFSYWNYYAQLDFAFIVNFGFGVGFTLGALRARHWPLVQSILWSMRQFSVLLAFFTGCPIRRGNAPMVGVRLGLAL